ncbi:DUF998 domain-containing protein [Thermoplasma sp. Kam2015]|uniref:DUF998 domain-containing protein n=1 Tax=Thermoplasma sp. Kam2015 TaxID=2094122 RepID=UPI001F3B04BE|nr:DUF998 domain-containing protein [Thermoplasma sp. Kam2015]
MNTMKNEQMPPAILGITGIAGPIIAISFILIDVGVSPWFLWSRNALSDLGVHQYGYLFNSGLIVEGILNVFFVISLKRIGIARYVQAMMIASGLSLAMVGVFNEHFGYLHLLFALIYFILFPVSIIIASASATLPGSLRIYGIAGSATAIAVIIVGIGFVFHFVTIKNVGLAVPEFIEAVILALWSIFAGLVVYGTDKNKVSNRSVS